MIDDELQPPPANLPNLVLPYMSQNEDDSSGGDISPERLENSLQRMPAFNPVEMQIMVPIEVQIRA